jgi:ATP-binding protein involved in chromosome partitioning
MKSYHDIPGDGGSRVLDQVVERHARMARALAGVRHRLAIGSGKGGVGKSTLTLQLAAAFAARGLQVAVLDADLNGPSQARLAGLAGRPLLPGAAGAVLPRTASGIRVLSLGSVLAEPQPLEFDTVSATDAHTWRATRERTLLEDLVAGTDWGAIDVLLVDLPPGPERTQQFAEFLGPPAAFLLVTVPSDLSRGVVARSAQALASRRVLGYVENMVGYWCADCGSVKPLFPSSGGTGGAVDIGVPCLARVPFDPALAALCDAGIDSAPSGRSGATDAIAALAARLTDLLEGR